MDEMSVTPGKAMARCHPAQPASLGTLTEHHTSGSEPGCKRAYLFGPEENSRVRAFVAQRLAADLSIEQLAALVGMSPRHFSRVFKSTFGCTPHAFVIQHRIDEACRRMRLQPDLALVEIAGSMGFSSQSHFTEAFRQRLGTTPARWRSGA